MTEQEEKAIKWMKSVRDAALVILDHIAENEPNVSPMLYTGRKEKAEIILNAFDELEQYRSLGTVEKLKILKKSALSGLELANIWAALQELKKYEAIGTVEEFREAKERQISQKPNLWGDGVDANGEFIYDMYDCPCCGKSYEADYDRYDYCPNCGQAIDWSDLEGIIQGGENR